MPTHHPLPTHRPLPIPRAAAVASFLLLGLAAGPTMAQVAPVSPRVQSFAGAASDGVACGAESLAANPAALARPCAGPTRMMLLPTVKVSVGSSAARGLLWEHRGALMEPGSLSSELDPAVRREILEAIGEDGLEHRQRLDVPIMQFTGGSVSGSFTFTTSVRGVVARDLAELILEGHDGSRVQYSLSDTRQDFESYFTLALGHGRTIGDYDVGVTGHFMVGLGLNSWQASDPMIDVDNRVVRAELVGAFAGERMLEGSLFDVGSPDGLAAGLDVGVMRTYGPYRLGLAVQNLVQWHSWSDDLQTASYQVVAGPDGVVTDLSHGPYDPANASALERRVHDRLQDDAHFPRRLRLGGAWETARTSVGAGVVLAASGRLDRDWSNLVSVGVEHRPFGPLRVQTGAAASLDGLFQLSAGAGLNLRGLNIDAAVTRAMGSGDAPGYTVGLGLSLTYDR